MDRRGNQSVNPVIHIGNTIDSNSVGHVDCFFDVPRLSTVQALLLLLKARESAPQRGYFFRSWMSMVNIIAMARDLRLDSHYELHKQGIGCGESPLECTTRTRVWQACFAYELMICAPQGMRIALGLWGSGAHRT